MEFKYPQEFEPKEMGIVAPAELGKHIELSEEFIKSLGISGNELEGINLLNKVFNVLCPFCKKGYLRLKKILPAGIPISSYASYPQPGAYWSGLQYDFDCFEECGATFSGIIKQFQACVD